MAACHDLYGQMLADVCCQWCNFGMKTRMRDISDDAKQQGWNVAIDKCREWTGDPEWTLDQDLLQIAQISRERDRNKYITHMALWWKLQSQAMPLQVDENPDIPERTDGKCVIYASSVFARLFATVIFQYYCEKVPRRFGRKCSDIIHKMLLSYDGNESLFIIMNDGKTISRSHIQSAQA